MSLLKQAGANLLRTSPISYKEQREQEIRVKRQRQLEYMRELDQQVKERAEKSKSRSNSKKRLKNNSSLGYERQQDSVDQDKYSKSAMLEELLKMDYETFKRGRPDKSRSRSSKKYHLIEQINNEGEYMPIPEYRTVFVDSQGKEISVGSRPAVPPEQQRDDKNYVSIEQSNKSELEEEQPITEREGRTDKSVEEELQNPNTSEKRSSSPSPESIRAEVTRQSQLYTQQKGRQGAEPSLPPLSSTQIQETKRLSSLLIAQNSFSAAHSDRIATLVHENRRRFPGLIEIVSRPDLQKQLAELQSLIGSVVEAPPRRAKAATAKPIQHDELIEIKDILSDIASISQPIPERRNRFIDKDLLLHKKINQRIGPSWRMQPGKGAASGGNLDEMLDSYPTLLRR